MSETHEIRLKIDAAPAQAGARDFLAAISAVKRAVKDLERETQTAFHKLQAGINGTSSTKKISLPTLDKSVMKDLASYAKTQAEAAKAAQITLKTTQGLLTALKGLGDAYSAAKRTTDGFNTAILKTNAALTKQIQLASLARSAVRQVRTAPIVVAPTPVVVDRQKRAAPVKETGAATTAVNTKLVSELTAIINAYMGVGASAAAASKAQVIANEDAANSARRAAEAVARAAMAKNVPVAPPAPPQAAPAVPQPPRAVEPPRAAPLPPAQNPRAVAPQPAQNPRAVAPPPPTQTIRPTLAPQKPLPSAYVPPAYPGLASSIATAIRGALSGTKPTPTVDTRAAPIPVASPRSIMPPPVQLPPGFSSAIAAAVKGAIPTPAKDAPKAPSAPVPRPATTQPKPLPSAYVPPTQPPGFAASIASAIKSALGTTAAKPAPVEAPKVALPPATAKAADTKALTADVAGVKTAYDAVAAAATAAGQRQVAANASAEASARKLAETVAAQKPVAPVARADVATAVATPVAPTALPKTDGKATQQSTRDAEALAKALAEVISKYAATGNAGAASGKRQSASTREASQKNSDLARAIAAVVAQYGAAGNAGTNASRKASSGASSAATALKQQERAAREAARAQEQQVRISLSTGEALRRAEVEAAKLSERLNHVGNTAGVSAVNAALAHLRSTLSGGVANYNELRAAISAFNAATSAQKVALTQAEGAQRANARAAREAAAEQRRAALTAQQVEREMRSIAAASSAAHAAFAKTTGNLRGLENAFSATFQAGSLFRNMLGSITIGTFTKNLYTTGNALEQFRVTMTVASGSMAAAQGEMQFIDEMTRRLGTDLGTARDNYSKFAISASLAGVSSSQTRDIFESVSMALSVLGKGTEDQNLAFLALEQMMSKGTVSSEELRRQLGERLPGAVNLMAKALGVTTGELQDMLKAGEISSADALPKFAAEVRKAYGPGLQQATQRAAFNLGTLRGEIQRIMEVVAESGFMQQLSVTFAKLTTALQSPEMYEAAQKLGEGFAYAAEMGGKAFLYFVENIDAVAKALKGLAIMVVVRQVGLLANAVVTGGLQLTAFFEAYQQRRGVVLSSAAAMDVNTASTTLNTRALQANAAAMTAAGAAGGAAATRGAAAAGALTRTVGVLGLFSRAIGIINPVVAVALTGLALWPLVMGNTAQATEDASSRMEEALRRAGVSMDEFAQKRDALSSGALRLNVISGDMGTFVSGTEDFFDKEKKQLAKYYATQAAVQQGTTTGTGFGVTSATDGFTALGIAEDALTGMGASSRRVVDNMLSLTTQTIHARGSVLELRDALAEAMAVDAGTRPVLQPVFDKLEEQARVEYALAKQKDSITELFGSETDRALKTFVADAQNVIATGTGFTALQDKAVAMSKEFPKMATAVSGVMNDLGTAVKNGTSPFTFLVEQQKRYASVADDIVSKQNGVRAASEQAAKANERFAATVERVANTQTNIIQNKYNAKLAPSEVNSQLSTIPDTSPVVSSFKADLRAEFGAMQSYEQTYGNFIAKITELGNSAKYAGTSVQTISSDMVAQMQRQIQLMPSLQNSVKEIVMAYGAFNNLSVEVPDLAKQFAGIPNTTREIRLFKDEVYNTFARLPEGQRTFVELDSIINRVGKSSKFAGTSAQTLSMTLTDQLASAFGVSGITSRQMDERLNGLIGTYRLGNTTVVQWIKDINQAANTNDYYNRIVSSAQGILSSAMSALSSLGSTALAQASGVNALAGAIGNLLRMASAVPSADFTALLNEATQAATVKAMDAKGQFVYGKVNGGSAQKYFTDRMQAADAEYSTAVKNAAGPGDLGRARTAYDSAVAQIQRERDQLSSEWAKVFETPDGSDTGGGGGGASAVEKLTDKIKNRTIALQSESMALREVASGTWQTEEAARLYAEALIRGNGVVDSNTVTMLRQMDAAAQLNNELEKLARDPVKEWLNSVPSWIEGARMIEAGAIDGLSNALAEFFKTGKFDFAKFASDIAGQMADVLAKQAVGWGLGKLGIDGSLFNPTGAAIETSGNMAAMAMGTAITTAGATTANMFAAAIAGGAIPALPVGGGVPAGGGGGGLLKAAWTMLTSFFSEGGYSDRPSVHTGMVSPSVFRNAPHFKNGTPNTSGIPAILHPNEAVVPLTKGRKIPVDMSTADPQEGKSVTAVSFGDINITIDHQGDLGDPAQLGKMATRLGELVETKIQEQLSVHMRYGGMLNPRG